MNKIYKFCRIMKSPTKTWLLAFLMMFGIWGGVKAQIINPSTDGGFEVGATFADNGWIVVNGTATNTWNIGNVPTGGIVTGSRCAYISQNAGVAYTFNNASTSVVHMYKDVTFPAGQTNINLSFNWLADGEASYDELIVSLVPTTYTLPSATTSLGTGVLAAPAIALGRFGLQTTPQTANISIPTSVSNNCTSAQIFRLVFTWKNDSSGGTNPPVAIDNISLTAAAAAAPLAGTYTVGPGGNYTTLTTAINDLSSRGVSAPVFFELNSSYVSTSEVFPINFNNIACNAISFPSSTNPVTIRPATGVTNRVITGASATQILNFNGVGFITIDGRPGGAGTTSELTLTNTNTSGSVIQYINDAANNTINYCTISGVNTSTTSGLIVIGTTTGANGNDNITITNNKIRDAATAPANLIYAAGTTTTVNTFNSGINISNNELFNYTSNAIFASTASSTWTINANSFYQTVSRAITSNPYTAIQTGGTIAGAGGHTITNNFIGGTDPNCGGAAMTLTGSGVMRLLMLSSEGGTSTPLSVQGNTIANINFTSSSTSTVHSFISVVTGNVNIGNIVGNTIGNQTTTGNISITLTGSAAGFTGMLLGSGTPGNINVANNTMGSITHSGTGTTNATFRGASIQGTPTSFTFNNNTIGSLTTANSISTTANAFSVGFISFSGATNQIYTNNTFANLSGTSTGTATSVYGLVLQGAGTSPNTTGTYTATNNTIRDIYSASSNSTSISVMGISVTNASQTTGNTLVSQNTIFNLGNTNTTAVSTSVAGIFTGLSGTASSIVSRNIIHSLTNTATGTTAAVAGIVINGGVGSHQNNVIRLGLSNAGTDITSPIVFRGILHTGTTAAGVYHNSVYIGGTGVTGAINTFAFQSTSTSAAGRDYRNNIFVNARSNGSGTGKHYAISLPGTAPSPAGLTSNFNILQASGTGGVLGLFNAVDQTTLGGWNTATGMDVNSQNANPNFVNPTGSGATFSLNLNTPTPAEGQGTLISNITDDFLGQNRNTLSPVDVGAYAGNFLSSPVIVITPLSNVCSVGARTLVATITDPDGVPTTLPGLPVLYWRLNNTGAYQPATATFLGSNQYQFSFGATAVVGDIVSYYIAAQDNLGNVGSLPGAGASGFGSNPPSATNATSAPYTYTIINSLSGTYLIGTGQTYTTLTAAINAYNTFCLTGPVTFLLNDATYPSETFPIVINSNAQASATNTLTIKPNVGINSTISGSNTNAIIRLNGADFVNIDGSNTVGGTTRNLTITNTNTSTSSAVVWINSASVSNAATNNSIRNSIIQGNDGISTLGSIIISGSVLGNASEALNNNITISNNQLSKAQNGVFAIGNTTTPEQGWIISNNNIGSTVPTEQPLRGIAVQNAQGVVINNNQIAGVNTATTTTASGILLGLTINSGTISNNQISNIKNTNTTGYGSNGIYLNASNTNTNLNIFNNIILDVAAYGYTTTPPGGWSQADNGYGIMVNAGGGYNIYYNTINLNTNQTTAGNSAAINIAVGSNLNIRNNILVNTQTTGTRYAIYSAVANSAFTAINYNNYFVSTGSAGIGFLGSARVTLANWQTATAQDANSLNTDPVFTSPTNLLPTSCALDDRGVIIASITTDNANITRNASTPDLGALEFTATTNVTTVITPVTGALTIGTLGVAYSQALTQATYISPTWSISAGTLPAGISINANTGLISGTPTQAGTFPITVRVLGGSCATTINYSLVINCPTVTFGTAPVNGTAGTAYTHTLGQTGLGTVTWSISGGTLPTGLSLDGTTGVISGTPTVAGTYNFTVQVQQSTCSYTQGYAIVIGCPVITFSPLSLPNGLVNTLYTPQVLSASAPGLSNDYTITLTTGSVVGMSFDSPTATWSGTPTTQGAYSLTFTATHNTANCSTTYTYNFVVACATVTITPLLPVATVGTAFSQVISQTGANPPFTWALTAGTLPAGIGFDGATGTLSGTPTEAGTFNITISLDLGGCTIPQPYAWVINCPTIVFPNTTAVNAVAGASYTLDASTTGTTQTPTYSVSPALPTGLTLDGATGQITGIPTVTAPSTTYTVTVSQTGGVCTAIQAYTFAVNCPTIVLNPATLPSPTVGNVYNQTLSTMGNASAVTFAVSSGALPTGVTLNPTTGVLSGAPSVSGAFSFDITATQANGPCTVTRSYTWNIVCPTVSITTASLANGTINIAYPAVTLTQTGYTGTISWAATGLPTGFTLDATTGVLSGTTATFGVYNVSVTLTQGICSVTKVLTLQIFSGCPAITVAPAQMPRGNVGAVYLSTTVVATGGVAPYTYTVTSGTSLPLGLTLSPAGVISGTPTTVGTLNVNITATDANGCNGSTFYLITVNAACTAITITPTTLNAGIIGTFYNQTLTSTGGTAPYSYTVTTGTLPTGLTLDASGSITGTTTAIGSSTFSVRVVDAIGCIGTANYTVVVNPVPTRVISISPTTLNFPDVIIGQSITSTFTITNNGNTPLTISGIQYPVGFSGNFTGVIAAAGSQIVTVTFAPNVVGSFGGTVIVNSNALSGTSTLAINGNGISNPTSIDNFGKPIVTVYPNPSADDFNVRFDNNWKGDYIVKVLDMSGKVVFEDKAEITDTVDEIQLRLGHLANGAYLLHLENKRGKTAIRIVRR